jgi:secondary thiamine-phosphate synthase enzyme
LDTPRRSSFSTVRHQPVTPTADVAGSLVVRAESLPFSSQTRLQIEDVTDVVMAAVQRMGVREGTVTVQSLHTTCAVVVNESQDALQQDFLAYLKTLVDPATSWRHDDAEVSDCDRRNTDSHLRALLLSPSVTLQVNGGEVVLGTWQRVLVVELDGPRTRSLRIQVMGVA